MNRSVAGLLIAALASVGTAACGGSEATAPTPTAQPTATDGLASIKVGRSRLGPILVDARGRTLYLFTEDKPQRVLCTSDYLNCPSSWPPLMATERPRGRAGVDARLMGSIRRTKPAGSQVTYNHHPLYLYVEDKRPGDVTGQGMFGLWYVLSPSGRPITEP
jgi:predicted lipoprotein with Yx(FWY)xxD motif